uniref:Amine oxidase domain-containing protein n=1 Tax=viral metagenome TaxID=1070528 RepID=A0A6C0HLR7_9ZZZZ
MNQYDIAIVGAGISGIYTAYKLVKRNPNTKILLLESSNRIGGRLHTVTCTCATNTTDAKHANVILDVGGARFSTNQPCILSLIKELNFTDKIYPIDGTTKYIPVNPLYNTAITVKYPTIDSIITYVSSYIKHNKIPQSILINTTLVKFIKQYLDSENPTLSQYIQDLFPYYSELSILNAYDAIKLFTNEFAAKTKYMILKGGLQQLTDKLYSHIQHKITLHKQTPLLAIQIDGKHNNTRNTHTTHTHTYTLVSSNGKTFKTSKLILALTQPALKKIKYIYNKIPKLINSVSPQPLYRMYACYPINPVTKKIWFDGIGKVATNLPIKYIIPINYDAGVTMISYTDGKYAKYWMQSVANDSIAFKAELSRQLHLMFPDIDIPKPKWIKHYPWTIGAAYWKTGSDSEKLIPQIIKPFKHEEIYICGEQFSHHQAWVEGALETSDMVLAKMHDSKALRKASSKASSKITLKKYKK